MKPRPIGVLDIEVEEIQRNSTPCCERSNRTSGFGLQPELRATEIYQHDQHTGQVPPGHMGNRPDVLGQFLATLGVLKGLELRVSA